MKGRSIASFATICRSPQLLHNSGSLGTFACQYCEDLPSQVKTGAWYYLLTRVTPMEFRAAGIPGAWDSIERKHKRRDACGRFRAVVNKHVVSKLQINLGPDADATSWEPRYAR
jgi:hypothetical protein